MALKIKGNTVLDISTSNNDINLRDGTGATSMTIKTGGFAQYSNNIGVIAFVENSSNITSSYTITDGKNAMSAGPVTLDVPVTVTISANSSWTIV